MNVKGSVQCGGCTLRVLFFKLVIKIDQSKMAKGHIFNMSLTLSLLQNSPQFA